MQEQQQQRRETRSSNLNSTKPGWRLALRWCTLLATLALALAVAPRAGATITVTSLDDSGPGSLRQAIADAASGDTIDFAVTGTITLTSGELVIDKNLNISGPGSTNLTVSGNNASRVLSFNSVTGAISGLTIANGSSSSGAGINNSGGSLVVSNCVISSNTNASANTYGGGIYNYYGTLTVRSCTISKNFGPIGGGIAGSGGAVWIFGSTLTDNHASDGGGIRNEWGSLVVANTTISDNSAAVGGGLDLYAGACTLENCTIVNNTASQASRGGGGIWVWAAGTLVNIYSSIVAGNSTSGAGPDCAGSVNSDDYNLIQNTNGCTITGDTSHNIYGKDPLLGPLAENGGPTPTHALLPGSPAIDHGSSGGLTTDQRGQPRIFNFPAYFDAADGSDIGAYELQERAQTGPVFIVNTTDDVDDGIPGIAHCSLREAINAANANADTNTVAFAAEVPGLHTGVTGTITLTNGQLSITNSVNINGPGAANLTVSGNNASRVFSFNNTTAAVSGLTIASGRLENGSRGAGVIQVGGALDISNCIVTLNTNTDVGGGIYNALGTMNLVGTMVCSNYSAWAGGGIFNDWGTLHVRGSALFRNGGGGIFSQYNAMLTLTNTTVSGNTGGGIGTSDSTVNFIVSSTICSNTSGGVQMHGMFQVLSCVIAGNSGSPPDCSGTMNSLDHNLIGNTNGCTITNLTAHNLYNQDPKLGPLGDLGGPTPTHALRFDSPALDAGNSGGLTTDQRGLPRPIDSPDIANAEGGDGSDIGAYEADPNLRISGFGMTDADVWLSFNSVWGRTYRVESTDRLPASWNVLTNNVSGTGGRFQALDGGAASLPRRFYRAVLLQ